MQNQQKDKGWNPYLAGALTGVVAFVGGLVAMFGARLADG